MRTSLGALVRRVAPTAVVSRLPPRLRARRRAALGLEPWPDLAVRHPLFRDADYRALRRAARAFDAPSPGKPVLERGHQTAYVLSRWVWAGRRPRELHD